MIKRIIQLMMYLGLGLSIGLHSHPIYAMTNGVESEKTLQNPHDVTMKESSSVIQYADSPVTIGFSEKTIDVQRKEHVRKSAIYAYLPQTGEQVVTSIVLLGGLIIMLTILLIYKNKKTRGEL